MAVSTRRLTSAGTRFYDKVAVAAIVVGQSSSLALYTYIPASCPLVLRPGARPGARAYHAADHRQVRRRRHGRALPQDLQEPRRGALLVLGAPRVSRRNDQTRLSPISKLDVRLLSPSVVHRRPVAGRMSVALLEAVRGWHVADPDLGDKPLLARLREQRPDLEAGNKEVREALIAVKAESEAK
eukprot:scaffold96525_cov63-Phaeocystis_antarctica.AAC.1